MVGEEFWYIISLGQRLVASNRILLSVMSPFMCATWASGFPERGLCWRSGMLEDNTRWVLSASVLGSRSRVDVGSKAP